MTLSFLSGFEGSDVKSHHSNDLPTEMERLSMDEAISKISEWI